MFIKQEGKSRRKCQMQYHLQAPEDHCRGQDQEVHFKGWTLSHIIPIQEIQVTIHLWIMNRAVEKDFQKAKTKADV